MKAIFLAIVAIPMGLYSQKTVEKVADACCPCVSKLDAKNLSREELEMQLGLCLMEPMMSNLESLKKELKIKADAGQESYRQIGEKIGIALVSRCPESLPLFMQIGIEERRESRELPPPPPAPEEPTASSMNFMGKVKGVKEDVFMYIQAENSFGDAESFLWLEPFDGSDVLEANMNALNGKSVEIKWKLVSIFDAKTKSYKKARVILVIEEK